MNKKQYCFLICVFVAVIALNAASVAFGAATPYISINKNASVTKIRAVDLYLQGPENVAYMKISNQEDQSGADWEAYATRKSWLLGYGAGMKTVYVRFKDRKNNNSQLYKAVIQLSPPASMDVDFYISADLKSPTGTDKIDTREVTLTLKYSEGVEDFCVSNDAKFSLSPNFIGMVSKYGWTLTPGSGVKTVYVQFRDANKKIKTVSHQVTYIQPAVYLSEGSLVKDQNSAVYYFGYDGRLHPFINSAVYHSWYPDFSNIHYVSTAKLRQYQVAEPACVRPGTWLVKFSSSARVYAVETGCKLRPLRSEVEAYMLYGKNWAKRVIDLDAVYQSGYHLNSYSVADKANNIKDSDSDGLSNVVEDEYGTSDSNYDSDNDGLSDYEEVNYWFTDPTSSDTDGDGYKDGREILSGYLPAGPGKLMAISSSTYSYPLGTVFTGSDNKLYFRKSDNNYYYIGKDSSDTVFKSNKLNGLFIAVSPYPLEMKNFKAKKINSAEDEIIYPMKFTGNVLTKF